jgi:hypothetical protein
MLDLSRFGIAEPAKLVISKNGKDIPRINLQLLLLSQPATLQTSPWTMSQAVLQNYQNAVNFVTVVVHVPAIRQRLILLLWAFWVRQ